MQEAEKVQSGSTREIVDESQPDDQREVAQRTHLGKTFRWAGPLDERL
jgi:hypothetical protein